MPGIQDVVLHTLRMARMISCNAPKSYIFLLGTLYHHHDIRIRIGNARRLRQVRMAASMPVRFFCVDISLGISHFYPTVTDGDLDFIVKHY